MSLKCGGCVEFVQVSVKEVKVKEILRPFVDFSFHTPNPKKPNIARIIQKFHFLKIIDVFISYY